ncbi:MAG: acyl carrier protein phosphodiesterase [bacterium]
MDPEFRRYSGIITDIVYDHFLAQNWQIWSPVSLEEFSENACKLVIKAKPFLPQNALDTILWMQSSASLVRYKNEAFIDQALKNISRRLSRNNPLANGFQQFEQNRSALEDDFLNFLPELKSFAEQWIADSS